MVNIKPPMGCGQKNIALDKIKGESSEYDGPYCTACGAEKKETLSLRACCKQ